MSVAAKMALSTMQRFIAFEYVRVRTTKNVVALIGFTIAKIATNVVTAKVFILARNIETSPGYQDTKTYQLGTVAVAASNDAYRRHVYSGLVRIANSAGRRDTP